MTALGAPAAPAADVDRIRRTYAAVLGDQRIGPPTLGDEQRAHLAGVLRGQMQLLVPAVEAGLPPYMPDSFGQYNVRQVVAEARAVLAVPVRGATSADDVFDLAVLCRALLILHGYTA